MFCPRCGCDLIEGFKICMDCRVHLMDGLGIHGTDENGSTKFVHFMTCFSRQEAESARSLLESNRIQAVVSSDEKRGARLWIHKGDASTAIQVFQERAAARKKPGI